MLDWIRVCHEINCKENTRNLIQKLHGMRSHTLSTSERAAPSRGFSVNLPGARSTHQHTDHMTEHNRNTTTPTVSSELNNETDEPETVDVTQKPNQDKLNLHADGDAEKMIGAWWMATQRYTHMKNFCSIGRPNAHRKVPMHLETITSGNAARAMKIYQSDHVSCVLFESRMRSPFLVT